MKVIFYTIILFMTISSDLVHMAYVLSFDQDNVELINDFKGENESEENKELGEEASKVPMSQFLLLLQLDSQALFANNSLSFIDNPFSRISTPPPDLI